MTLFIYSLIFQEIIEKIIFPLMSYTEKDAELWETDPYEYIRVKVKICENPYFVKQCRKNILMVTRI